MKTLFPQEKDPPTNDEALSKDTKDDKMSLQTCESWELIKSALLELVDEKAFCDWIKPIKAVEKHENELTLLAPDMLFYQVLVSDYLDKIERCKSSLGMDAYSIRIGLLQPETPGKLSEQTLIEKTNSNESEPELGESVPALDTDEIQISEKNAQAFAKTLSRTSKLNPNYTFETFVRGPSNQFALATCLNVAENPGLNYNPLFLYGSTGLGKTHLLHAVGNAVARMNSQAIVTYISSERFMNEMIYCIRHNKMWDFRQKYRHCDLFLMDDIQFISGNKAATQEEFFHTFNTLYEAKKQIIITSDLFPQDIPDIEERLRNRFQWGLIADIQPPDVEHRIAILINKAEKLGVNISNDVAEFIANHAKRNVRELEGALHRIAAFAALQGRPVDLALARETFQSVMGDNPKKLSIEAIQKTVANHFKVKLADLKSKKRLRVLTQPRQIAMYLARVHTNSSYPEIGERFGGKDHTTIMHAVKKIEKERYFDLDLKAHLDNLERQIEQLT